MEFNVNERVQVAITPFEGSAGKITETREINVGHIYHVEFDEPQYDDGIQCLGLWCAAHEIRRA